MRWARATKRVMKSRSAKPANSATRRTTVDANERFPSVVPTTQPLPPNPQGAHDGGRQEPEPRVAGTRGTPAAAHYRQRPCELSLSSETAATCVQNGHATQRTAPRSPPKCAPIHSADPLCPCIQPTRALRHVLRRQ